MTLTLNNLQQVIKRTNPSPDYYFNYYYDSNGNISKIEYYVQNIIQYTKTFVFDNQHSVLTNIKGNYFIYLDYITMSNNIIDESEKDYVGVNNFEVKYDYVYNSDEFPTTQNATVVSGNATSGSFYNFYSVK